MIAESRLKKLYLEESKSMQEISVILGCSLNQVQYWMKKYGVVSRSRSDALYQKHNPDGDPFQMKEHLSEKDFLLLGLGLGLWWGEGSKKHKGTIRLGNTDPRLIKKFVEFLTDICGVQKGKIRFGLQLFSDMDPLKVKKYWMDALGVPEDQFQKKIVVTPARSIGTYREKTKYGVLTIYCANVRLREKLDGLMRRYAGYL